MKKILATLLAMTLTASVFGGCSGGSTPTSSSETPSAQAPSTAGSAASADAAQPSDGPVELSFSWWGGDSRHEATQKAIEAFTAKYPNISVKTNYGAWTGWEDAMSTALYAGTAQDVNQVNWNWIFNYDNGGKTFVDLNSLSDTIDLTQFDPKALEQCTVNGSLSAIPVAMTGRIFYWNEAAFEKAGIPIPKTYDELLAAGETFKTKLGDDHYPMVMAEYDRMIFLVWALECKYGKDWVVDGKLNYTQEEIESGLELIQTLEQSHVIPSIQTIAGDGAESLDKNPKWMEGRYGGIFEWDSAASKFSSALNEDQKFAVGEYLTGFGDSKGGFTKVSLGLAITQTCKNPKEAAMLIEFLLNDEEGAKIMGSERGIPLSKKALEVCKAGNLLDATVAQANERVLAWCSNKLDPTFEDAKLKASDGIYYDAMAGLSYGDYTVQDAAQTLIDGINDALASAAK